MVEDNLLLGVEVLGLHTRVEILHTDKCCVAEASKPADPVPRVGAGVLIGHLQGSQLKYELFLKVMKYSMSSFPHHFYTDSHCRSCQCLLLNVCLFNVDLIADIFLVGGQTEHKDKGNKQGEDDYRLEVDEDLDNVHGV